jgi:hypothetical protein
MNSVSDASTSSREQRYLCAEHIEDFLCLPARFRVRVRSKAVLNADPAAFDVMHRCEADECLHSGNGTGADRKLERRASIRQRLRSVQIAAMVLQEILYERGMSAFGGKVKRAPLVLVRRCNRCACKKPEISVTSPRAMCQTCL